MIIFTIWQSVVVTNVSRRDHQVRVFEFIGLGAIIDLEWVSQNSFASLSDVGVIRLWCINQSAPERSIFHVSTLTLQPLYFLYSPLFKTNHVLSRPQPVASAGMAIWAVWPLATPKVSSR